MAKINVMPKHLAELIAAGEVVERPASIVKELLENSIDAGASIITVEIKNGGISYIRVSDNGSGIPRGDVPAAFISHATSKISTKEDLNSILTLGFRGEALPSIAAVASVELLTSTEDEEIGTRYLMEYGEQTLIDDAGCPKGTTITVRDLFLRTPARMKFLKRDVTEANAVASIVDRTALSHPEISFRFIREGKQVLMTSGKGDSLVCIREVLGKDFADALIPCEGETNAVRVQGFITKPSYSRPNRNLQYFFLNKRYVRTGTASAAISEAYKGSIMTGKFPSCVLNIAVNPSSVDVNVHPAKIEVRFSDEKSVFSCVYAACKSALAQGDKVKQITPSKTNAFTYPEDYKTTYESNKEQITFPKKREDFWQTVQVSKPKEPTPKNKEVKTTLTACAPREEIEKGAGVDLIDDILLKSPGKKQGESTPSVPAAAPLPPDINEFEEEEFRLVGEAFLTYIICEYKKKLVIIDKHAAHERIIYEELKSTSGERSGQVLLAPVTVNLTKEEYSVILENLEVLSKAAFAVEDFGNGCVLVSECPMELSVDEIESIITEIAGKLAQGKQNILPEKLDWIFHSVACRSAIKAGNFTSKLEMERFAKQLLSMPDIRYCPHGRPIMIEMTQRELEKNFGRI